MRFIPGVPSARELSDTITFRTVGKPFDSFGRGSSPVSYATTGAKIVHTGSRVEASHHAERVVIDSYEVWTRYVSGANATMEILWGSDVLVIRSGPLDVDNRHRWLRIEAEKITEYALS